MGLFPKLPPEVAAMLINPGAMFDQVRSFVAAAKALIAAVDQHRAMTLGSVTIEAGSFEKEMDKADETLWHAADAFKAELAKLPDLPGGKVIDHGTR